MPVKKIWKMAVANDHPVPTPTMTIISDYKSPSPSYPSPIRHQTIQLYVCKKKSATPSLNFNNFYPNWWSSIQTTIHVMSSIRKPLYKSRPICLGNLTSPLPLGRILLFPNNKKQIPIVLADLICGLYGKSSDMSYMKKSPFGREQISAINHAGKR